MNCKQLSELVYQKVPPLKEVLGGYELSFLDTGIMNILLSLKTE